MNSPLKQWGEVQDAIGKAYTQIADALDKYFDSTFHHWPDDTSTLLTDPKLIPSQIKGGRFAGDVKVGVINKDVYGALGASAINALWVMDKVMIIKISSAAYGHGDPCTVYPKYTSCLDGVAYIFVRFQTFNGNIDAEGGLGSDYYARFNVKNWFVFGASDYGSGGDGSANKNNLDKYALNLDVIAKASEKTQKDHGYLYDNQNGQTIQNLEEDPLNLAKERLMFFNIPICDIDSIIGPGKHLADKADDFSAQYPDDPISYWGLCTCLQAQGWPKDKGYDVPQNDRTLFYTDKECRDKGWKS